MNLLLFYIQKNVAFTTAVRDGNRYVMPQQARILGLDVFSRKMSSYLTVPFVLQPDMSVASDPIRIFFLNILKTNCSDKVINNWGHRYLEENYD